MKIGFVITAHWSEEIRPQGNDLLTRCFNSIYENVIYDFNIYIVDNESEFSLDIPDDGSCKYFRIDDQYEKGLTGAWNKGINEAVEDGCDIIFNCNDDLWFNSTINKLIEYIIQNSNENHIYSGVTDGILGTNSVQKSNKPLNGVVALDCKHWHSVLNGFFFGMTKEHYTKFRFKETEYFNVNNKFNEGDGKWGGQEGQWIENSANGLCGIIVRECFIPHTKLRHWKTARNKERNI